MKLSTRGSLILVSYQSNIISLWIFFVELKSYYYGWNNKWVKVCFDCSPDSSELRNLICFITMHWCSKGWNNRALFTTLKINSVPTRWPGGTKHAAFTGFWRLDIERRKGSSWEMGPSRNKAVPNKGSEEKKSKIRAFQTKRFYQLQLVNLLTTRQEWVESYNFNNW